MPAKKTPSEIPTGKSGILAKWGRTLLSSSSIPTLWFSAKKGV